MPALSSTDLMRGVAAALLAGTLIGCRRGDEPARAPAWAFASELDGTVAAGEFCRESLASVTRGAPGEHLIEGVGAPYRVYVFPRREDCETALAAMRWVAFLTTSP